jgi:hypothetical protein
MTELKSETPFKPLNPNSPREARIAGGLADLINKSDIVEGDGDMSQFSPPSDVIPTAAEQRRAIPRPPVHPSSSNESEDEGLPLPPATLQGIAPQTGSNNKREMPSQVFTTGRLRAGKDDALTKLGYTIHSFAEPLYALQEMFFGTKDKSAPGAREFLQTVGQWGRGEINEQYRLTPARATFITLIRSLAAANQLPDLKVNWAAFGSTQMLWVDALLARVAELPGRVAVSNVRFENEYERMTEAGWTHFHVMCSPATWAKRLAKAGLNPKSPSLTDMSEKLGANMDADVYSKIKMKPAGNKMRVIWNDDEVKPPSKRLYTLSELAS